jgi:hypothetical protein
MLKTPEFGKLRVRRLYSARLKRTIKPVKRFALANPNIRLVSTKFGSNKPGTLGVYVGNKLIGGFTFLTNRYPTAGKSKIKVAYVRWAEVSPLYRKKGYYFYALDRFSEYLRKKGFSRIELIGCAGLKSLGKAGFSLQVDEIGTLWFVKELKRKKPLIASQKP